MAYFSPRRRLRSRRSFEWAPVSLRVVTSCCRGLGKRADQVSVLGPVPFPLITTTSARGRSGAAVVALTPHCAEPHLTVCGKRLKIGLAHLR